MTTSEFKVGDRVESRQYPVGTGMIVDFSNNHDDLIGVEFDNPPNDGTHFHNCGGKGRMGYCWYVWRRQLQHQFHDYNPSQEGDREDDI